MDIANGLVPADSKPEDSRAMLNPISAKEAKTARPLGARRGGSACPHFVTLCT